MKEKIKKIFRVIFTIIAILWILFEITSYYGSDLTKIVGILIIWGMAMYLLKGRK